MSAQPTIKFMALPLAELARQRLRERNNRGFCKQFPLVIFHKNTAIVLWRFHKKLFRYDIIRIHSCKRLRKEVL